MGAGARRRALRRRETDAAEARESARFWYELAEEWGGPQRGRTVEADSDAGWALEMARACMRGADLLAEGPTSLRSLSRLVRTRAQVETAIEGCVARLRGMGATWEQIAAELGLSREGVRKRYGGGGDSA